MVLDPLSVARKGSMSVRACVRASSFLTSVSGMGGGGIVGETGSERHWSEDGRQRPLGRTTGRRKEFPTRIKVERSEEVETTQRHQVRTKPATYPNQKD